MSIEQKDNVSGQEPSASIAEVPSADESPRRSSEKLLPTVRSFFKRRSSVRGSYPSEPRRSSLPHFIKHSSYKGNICFLCEE